jgi:hypothetical protein
MSRRALSATRATDLAAPAFSDDEVIVEAYEVREELAESAIGRVAQIVGEESVERVGGRDGGGVLGAVESLRAARHEREGQRGVPAVVESGEIVEVIDAAYVGLYGEGYRSRDVPLVHRYRIHVEELDEGVEVAIEYSGARSSTDGAQDREVSSLEGALRALAVAGDRHGNP